MYMQGDLVVGISICPGRFGNWYKYMYRAIWWLVLVYVKGDLVIGISICTGRFGGWY